MLKGLEVQIFFPPVYCWCLQAVSVFSANIFRHVLVVNTFMMCVSFTSYTKALCLCDISATDNLILMLGTMLAVLIVSSCFLSVPPGYCLY